MTNHFLFFLSAWSAGKPKPPATELKRAERRLLSLSSRRSAVEVSRSLFPLFTRKFCYSWGASHTGHDVRKFFGLRPRAGTAFLAAHRPHDAGARGVECDLQPSPSTSLPSDGEGNAGSNTSPTSPRSRRRGCAISPRTPALSSEGRVPKNWFGLHRITHIIRALILVEPRPAKLPCTGSGGPTRQQLCNGARK